MRLFCFSSHFSGIAEKRLIWDTPEALPAPKTQPPEEKPKDSLTKEENDRVKAMYDTLKTVTPSEAEKKFMALYEKYAELKEKTKNTTAKKEKDQENRVTILRKIAEAGNGEAITDAVTNPPVPNPDEVPSDVERVENPVLELNEKEEGIAEKVYKRIETGGSNAIVKGSNPAVYIDRIQESLDALGVYKTFTEKYDRYKELKNKASTPDGLTSEEKVEQAFIVKNLKIAVSRLGQDWDLIYAHRNFHAEDAKEVNSSSTPATTPEPTPATPVPKAAPAEPAPAPKAPALEPAPMPPSKEALVFAAKKNLKQDPDGTKYFDSLGYLALYEAAQRDIKNSVPLYEAMRGKSVGIVNTFDTDVKDGKVMNDTDSWEHDFSFTYNDPTDAAKSGKVNFTLRVPEAKKYLANKPENKRYRDDVFSIPGIKFIIEKPAVTDKTEAPKPGAQPKGSEAPKPPVAAPAAPQVPSTPPSAPTPAPAEKVPETPDLLKEALKKRKIDKDGAEYFETFEDLKAYEIAINGVKDANYMMRAFNQNKGKLIPEFDEDLNLGKGSVKNPWEINATLTKLTDPSQKIIVILRIADAKKYLEDKPENDTYRNNLFSVPGIKFVVAKPAPKETK